MPGISAPVSNAWVVSGHSNRVSDPRIVLHRREANPADLTGEFRVAPPVGPDWAFRYRVLRVWEEPAESFLTGGPALLLTKRIDSHALRSLAGTISMFCNFAAYIFLPMADATAIGFAAPLFIVMLAALMLGERVHIYRWSAVILGFTGVLIFGSRGDRLFAGHISLDEFVDRSGILAGLVQPELARVHLEQQVVACVRRRVVQATAFIRRRLDQVRANAVRLQLGIVVLEPLDGARRGENLARLQAHVLEHVLEESPSRLVVDGACHAWSCIDARPSI